MNAVALQRSSRRLILAGGGHTHALVLRRWAMHGVPEGVSVTLVNRTGSALYSGTVPALIGGLIDRHACRIDLRQLAGAAGVTLICAEIIGINLEQRQLLLQDRPPLPWDLLSLDVGAVTAPATSAAGTPIATLASSPAIKPLEPFLRWWDALQGLDDPISVVGSGAAGLEVALAMAGRRRRQGRPHQIRLVSRTAPLPEPFQTALKEAGIAVLEKPEPNSRILRCTGSRAPDWLAAAGLPYDPSSGRLLTTATLQVLGQPAILAAGDCAQINIAPRPPSGVWAVRAGLPLARNLERHLQDRPLKPWRPPRLALQLLGDGGAVSGQPRAMARWGSIRTPFHPLIWQLKQRIDRRFIQRFASLSPMAAAGRGPMPAAAMVCHGCAAKLAAEPLTEALRNLQQGDPSASPPTAEDAHPLLVAADGRTWWQSVDGFPALVSDPWLNGRLTALHACSDLWACGAQVHSALAMVSLPRQAEALQADLLSQILAGIRSVLQPLGAELLGGHTLQAVGPDAGAASPVVQLTVNGSSPPERAWPKGGLQPGDALILTRCLGSGVLFAAAQTGAAEPEWIDAALTQMQQSQAPVVDLLDSHGCHGCTDITGFGLLGHLGEMVAAAHQRSGRRDQVAVDLQADALPAFEGALPCLALGLASSLAPANQRSLALLGEQGPVRLQGPAPAERLALLVDPQTCGPLLAAVPAAAAPALLVSLHRAGFAQACRIGSVNSRPD